MGLLPSQVIQQRCQQRIAVTAMCLIIWRKKQE